ANPNETFAPGAHLLANPYSEERDALAEIFGCEFQLRDQTDFRSERCGGILDRDQKYMIVIAEADDGSVAWVQVVNSAPGGWASELYVLQTVLERYYGPAIAETIRTNFNSPLNRAYVFP